MSARSNDRATRDSTDSPPIRETRLSIGFEQPRETTSDLERWKHRGALFTPRNDDTPTPVIYAEYNDTKRE